MTYKVDKPGRGAWNQIGGLLPLTPTNKNPAGYWRAPAATEVMIGRPYTTQPTIGSGSFTRLVIHEATRALQRLLHVDDDGLFGPASQAATLAAQKSLGLGADGVLGPSTARGLMNTVIIETAGKYKIPVERLGGVAVFESGLCPAAVGVNGYDTGPCQINLDADAAASITVAQATDPAWSLDWSAQAMRAVYDRWNGKTSADPWDIAVANHNSPLLAFDWARDGKPPFSQSRADNGFPQIDQYVAAALAAWKG